ncbi:hypothetical protein KR093_004284, partial [Drosophila rubida]
FTRIRIRATKCTMASEIQSFYKNKVVMLTGGSGFLGKVTIEKLLRSTEVKRIYVLIRPKKGQAIQERIADWKNDVVFSVLLQEKPDALKRLVPIEGDVCEADLGISQADRQLLAKEVNVLIHGAATTRFTAPLHVALTTNTRPTRMLLQLAKEMSHLEAFVYVSTAFCNCISFHIDERFYPEHLNCNADQALGVQELLGDKLTDEAASALMAKFPNTYTFTKALSEQILERESGEMPVSIFRPGIVVGSYKEPFDGWIASPYGATMLLFGVAMGVLRTTMLNRKSHANIVPVDYCVNLLLAVAWETATKGADRKKKAIAPPPPLIYNNVPHETNMLTWGGYKDFAAALGGVYPLEQSKWLPFLQCTTSPWVFYLLSFFYHYVPAFFVDLALRLSGRQPQIVKMYQKLHKQMQVMAHFGINCWHFKTRNTDQLWSNLSAKDREIFEFDMASLNWKDFFYRSMSGIRSYLALEENTPESFKRGRKV